MRTLVARAVERFAGELRRPRILPGRNSARTAPELDRRSRLAATAEGVCVRDTHGQLGRAASAPRELPGPCRDLRRAVPITGLHQGLRSIGQHQRSALRVGVGDRGRRGLEELGCGAERAVRRHHAGPYLLEVGPHERVVRASERIADGRVCLGELPGAHRVARSLEQPPHPQLVVRRQPRGPLPRERRGLRAPAARAPSSLLELGGNVVVGPHGGQRPVPSTAVERRRVDQRSCKRPMRVTPRHGIGAGVHGRAHERVPKVHGIVDDLDEALALRGLERGEVERQRHQSAIDRSGVDGCRLRRRRRARCESRRAASRRGGRTRAGGRGRPGADGRAPVLRSAAAPTATKGARRAQAGCPASPCQAPQRRPVAASGRWRGRG